LVELWPAGSRPYIGGTNGNSIFELIFGYNGIGRLDGTSNNGSPGGGTGGFSSGQTGLGRLFGSEMGSQISWLLPAAFISLAGVLWSTRAAPRTDRLRASALLWGGWLVVTAAVFSFASGIIHPYYTVALAPAIAALVAIGVVALWHSSGWTSTILVVSAVWTFELLGRSTWHPWLARRPVRWRGRDSASSRAPLDEAHGDDYRLHLAARTDGIRLTNRLYRAHRGNPERRAG
jgi:4-amino-4-deoxy-L-arabinose transferase-like glycosyltransferase